MLEEDQDYDFEAQYGLETTDYDEDSRPSKHQSKASTDAKGTPDSAFVVSRVGFPCCFRPYSDDLILWLVTYSE